jgi:hypothetical protein
MTVIQLTLLTVSVVSTVRISTILSIGTVGTGILIIPGIIRHGLFRGTGAGDTTGIRLIMPGTGGAIRHIIVTGTGLIMLVITAGAAILITVRGTGMAGTGMQIRKIIATEKGVHPQPMYCTPRAAGEHPLPHPVLLQYDKIPGKVMPQGLHLRQDELLPDRLMLITTQEEAM